MMLFILLAGLGCAFAQTMGPADIDFDGAEKCSENALGFENQFTVKRINETHVGFDGSATIPFPIDEKIDINITVAKWEDDQWKENIFTMYRPDACRFMMGMARKPMQDLMTAAKIPPECPVAEGSYTVENYVLDTSINMHLMYGKYKIDMIMLRERVQFTCFRMFATTKPKPSSK